MSISDHLNTSEFLFIQIGDEAVDVKVYNGLTPFGREQELAIFLVVHEQILGQNRRAKRMLQHIEHRHDIRVTVRIVRADLLPE